MCKVSVTKKASKATVIGTLNVLFGPCDGHDTKGGDSILQRRWTSNVSCEWRSHTTTESDEHPRS